jgi:glutaredoxin
VPIYESICPYCHREPSLLVRGRDFFPKCSCRMSANSPSTISGLAYHKSLETVWKDSGESEINTTEDYCSDHRNIWHRAEKRFQETEQELPSHIQEKIRAAGEGVLSEPFEEFEGASPTSAYD